MPNAGTGMPERCNARGAHVLEATMVDITTMSDDFVE